MGMDTSSGIALSPPVHLRQDVFDWKRLAPGFVSRLWGGRVRASQEAGEADCPGPCARIAGCSSTRSASEGQFCSEASKKLVKACSDLRWAHDTSTRRRSETNAVLERAVRPVKEGAAATVVIRGPGTGDRVVLHLAAGDGQQDRRQVSALNKLWSRLRRNVDTIQSKN